MSGNARRTTPRLVRDNRKAPFALPVDRRTFSHDDDLTCPKCERTFARRSHRKGLIEFLCGLVLIYPYRCQLCAHRFLATPKLSPRTPHREFERLHVRFPASFRSAYLDQTITGEGTILNLSIHGCNLTSQQPLGKGSLLRLQVRYAEHDAPVDIDVAVVRSSSNKQLGVEFLSLQPNEEERLRRLMEHLLDSRFH